MRVDGDGQIGIEYSYDDALYGKQTGSIVSQPGVGWEAKGLVLRGSTYRLYALSTASNGHVAASVVVIADSDGRTLLSVSKQNDGGSVEITGTVP